MLDEKNAALLTAHGVYTKQELKARCEALLENYCKTVKIEAKTMLWMSRRQLRPAVSACAARIAEQLRAVQGVSASAPCESEIARLDRLCVLREEIAKRTDALEAALSEAEGAEQVRDRLIPAMLRLREACDAAEPLVDAEQWPIPTYSELLFGV